MSLVNCSSHLCASGSTTNSKQNERFSLGRLLLASGNAQSQKQFRSRPQAVNPPGRNVRGPPLVKMGRFITKMNSNGRFKNLAPDTKGIQLQAKVGKYRDLVMTLIFVFGLTFQLPIVQTLLAKNGVVSAKALRAMHRYAIVGLFAVPAVFTPPNAFSMLSSAVPLVMLYEVSISAPC
ncbi:MAG: twin-arginine translocase subunit TatC [Rhizomicrobium sp.]